MVAVTGCLKLLVESARKLLLVQHNIIPQGAHLFLHNANSTLERLFTPETDAAPRLRHFRVVTDNGVELQHPPEVIVEVPESQLAERLASPVESRPAASHPLQCTTALRICRLSPAAQLLRQAVGLSVRRLEP